MAELIANIEGARIIPLIVVFFLKFVLREYGPRWRVVDWRVMKLILIVSDVVRVTSAGRHLICRPRGDEDMHLLLQGVWLRRRDKLVAEERKSSSALDALTSRRKKAAVGLKEVHAHKGGMRAFNYSTSRCIGYQNRRIRELYDERVKNQSALALNPAANHNHGALLEDADGRPICRYSTEATLGKRDLYPYYDTSILPPRADIGVNTAFALFMKGNRAQHGDRKGSEINRFDGATGSMEYGELFLRFKNRDGFLVTRPKGNMVVLKTKAA